MCQEISLAFGLAPVLKETLQYNVLLLIERIVSVTDQQALPSSALSIFS